MFGWLKNAVLVIVLIAVIILSFWVSFMIGKRMISPIKKIPTKAMPQEESHTVLPPEINLEVQGITFEAAEKTGMTVKDNIAEKLPVTIPEKKTERTLAKEKTIVKVEAKKIEKKVAGGYVVQAGAFSHKQNADSLADELKQKGFEASIVRSRKLYKVYAGKYEELDSAKELSKKINDAGFEGIIRPYGPNGRDD